MGANDVEQSSPSVVGLLRGRGPDFGPAYLAWPLEHRTMLDVLGARAIDAPDKAWVIFDEDHHLTYGDAWDLIQRVAGALGGSVGPAAHVALLLGNTLEFLPALYGVMASGGVVAPLNPQAKGRFLQAMIEDSEATTLIVEEGLLGHVLELAGLGRLEQVIVVGGSELAADSQDRLRVVPWSRWVEPPGRREFMTPRSWNELCMLMFTSGTTGRAKAVMYSHHYLYLYSAASTDGMGWSKDDVLTTPLPLCHAAALHLVANAAAHSGTTAHLKSRFTASGFWRQAAEDGATGGLLLGPMAAMILKATERTPAHGIRQLWISPPTMKEAFEERFGVDIVYQAYGMTECQPLPPRRNISTEDPLDALGHVARWMEWGVVDESDRMLSPGERGQLVVRSLIPHGMFDGYYGQPETTVQATRNFMFHTGDLVSYDTTGLIRFHGRMTDRIRRRGELISAAELESSVLEHPEVLEVAAYGVPSEIGEEDVKVDIVAHGRLDLESFEAWLRERLPKFMVPRYVEQRDALPKTPSERVQKHLLTDQGADRPSVWDTERR